MIEPFCAGSRKITLGETKNILLEIWDGYLGMTVTTSVLRDTEWFKTNWERRLKMHSRILLGARTYVNFFEPLSSQPPYDGLRLSFNGMII